VDKPIAAKKLPMKSAGRLVLQLRYRGVTHQTSVITSPEHDGMLISWKASQAFGFLSPQYPEPVFASINSVSPVPRSLPLRGISTNQLPKIRELILSEFADVFRSSNDTELPKMCEPPMKIELQEDAIPYSVNGARPISFAQRDTVKKMLAYVWT